jgi:hypothetical protein
MIFKLFVLSVALFALVGGIYWTLMRASMTVRCSERLLRIYQALELYDMERGALPRLAFFPDEPMTDPDSIRVALEEYGVDHECWICPASHPSIANTGLSYIWNVRLNSVSLRSLTERQWMLVEINALSRDVAAPHFGRYNVLFTDGQVERRSDIEDVMPGF